MTDSTEKLLAREKEVRGAFSPSAPIRQKDLFAGRTSQLLDVEDALLEPGQHAVIYGERGVGKTSLAAVCKEIFGAFSIKVNCTASDSFTSVWQRVFKEAKLISTKAPFGFASEGQQQSTYAADLFRDIPILTPDDVKTGLEILGADHPVTIYFDEFDRLNAEDRHASFADTIKMCSDQVTPATIVIVGVADDVSDLIVQHGSIERALVQINMPRMSRAELADIILKGLASVGMTADIEIVSRITGLSQGLPHYTHLLAQYAATKAVWDDRAEVAASDVDDAIRVALSKAQESLTLDYYRATHSNRENMYKQVLLACALATSDERGYFTAASVRDPLSQILGRPMDIPAYGPHLNALSSDRGPVLKKEGTKKKFRYRFIKPIFQPFVLMRGVADQMIDMERMAAISGNNN